MLISYANLVYCAVLGTAAAKEQLVLQCNAISQVDRFKYLGSMETLPEICAGLQLQEMPPDNWVVVGKRYQPESEETAGEIARVEHSSLGYRKLDIK